VGLGRLGPGSWLLNWARVQWAITIGLVPLLLALFQQVSLVSPLANAAAIPLVSLGVVPMTLLGLVLPTDGLIVLAGSLMRLCHSLLAALSALPEAVWQQAAPAFWTLPIALAGVVWLLAPRGLPARWLGLVGLLPLVLASAPSPRPGSVWLDVLDVGQGLSSIVRTAHHVLVFDTGPVFSSEADSGSRIVVPHLRGRGMSRVDGLIVSHDDRDHSGGTESLLRATPVRWVASSLPAGDPRLARAERTLPCFAGQAWEWDDVRFEMLHPAWASYNNAAAARDSDSRDNDRSCVLRVVASGGSILLTADIEGTAEAQLLERAATPLSSEVVVVAHHGSATSSSHAFVEHVHPRIAIVPVGHRNRFGHPAAAVLERYARAGAAIYRTDRDGAVLVRLERDITVQTWRGLYRRYWQGR
jgi:competence protein ComEC